MIRRSRTMIAAAAVAAIIAAALVAGSGAAEAATAPVSHPRIIAHFSLSAGSARSKSPTRKKASAAPRT